MHPIFLYHPLTELFPFPLENILSSRLLAIAQAAVFQAPLSKLSPSMKIHILGTDHDLIELEGERRP